MEAANNSIRAPLRYERAASARLLKLAPDAALVRRVRAGDERAFAVIYERHLRPILAFCRHILGSREEAEDAVQQTFISAYRDMLRSDKELKLRPWLYRIARNHCISTLRRRRPEAELDDGRASVAGLAEAVGARSDLRALLADLAQLPDDQREALVLTELCDNSHAEAAEIIGCDREKVKSLVFQARSSLMKGRQAREMSCEDVRLQLSSLKGSALRRGALGRHLALCEGCRAFRAEVKRQRQQLAVLFAVVPTVALKVGASNAMAAGGAKAGLAGIGSASAAGSAAGSGIATGASGGSLAAVTAKAAGSGLVIKGVATAAAVTVLAAGGAVGVQRVNDSVSRDDAVQTHDGGPPGTLGGAAAQLPGARQGARGATRAPSARLQRERHRSRAARGRSESASSIHADRGKHAGVRGKARGRGSGANKQNQLERGQRKRTAPHTPRLHETPVRPQRPASVTTPRKQPAERASPPPPDYEPIGPTLP
jgi:RNA polymerase sigma factor (sigma-70 family)